MRLLCAIAACVLMPLSAVAQESTGGSAPSAATSTAPAYAVQVETLTIAEERAGLMETGRSAGGYALISRATGRTTGFGLTREGWRMSVTYKFGPPGAAAELQGVCRLQSEGRSLLGVTWNQRTAGLYACSTEGQPEGAYAMEVMVPAFREASVGMSFGGIGLGASKGDDERNPDIQAILRARMSYDGATYEATPTGFGREGLIDPRVVEGYVILRDGAPVGRVDFPDKSVNGGTITAPTADADGRKAVLFMTMLLHAMPDLYSSYERERRLNR